MQKIEMIWAMFKKYMNNPNHLVSQDDVLKDLFGNGAEDLHKFMNTLGIPLLKYKVNITYGQLLNLLKIM